MHSEREGTPRRTGRHRTGLVRAAVAAVLLVAPAAPAQALEIRLYWDSLLTDNPSYDPDGLEMQRIAFAAASYWEGIIHDDHTLHINLRWGDGDWLGLHTPGDTEDGRETVGRIQLGHDDHNPDLKWFFDPTPFEHSEFSMSSKLYRDLNPVTEQSIWYNGDVPDTFEVWRVGNVRASAPQAAKEGFDAFTTMLHEFGHALGMTGNVASGQTDDLHYDPDPVLVGGANIDINCYLPGDLYHIKPTFTLMYPRMGDHIRMLPDMTSILAIASASGWETLDIPRKEFVGPGTGWGDRFNWIGNCEPHVGDDVFVRNGQDVLMGANPEIKSLLVGGGSELRTGANNVVVIHEDLTIGDGYDEGTELKIEANAILSADNCIVAEDGALTITGGRLVARDGMSSRSTVSLTQSAEVIVFWHDADWNVHSGTVSHTSGSVEVGRNLNLGFELSTPAQYTLDGAGSTITADQLNLGLSGPGTFTQNDGSITVDYVIVGNQENMPGTYTMTGGALAAGEHIHVGYIGRGTFTMTNGTVSAPALTIRNGSDMAVNGGTVTVAGDLLVMNGGQLTVGAATVIADELVTGPSGMLTVGIGSTLRVNRLSGLDPAIVMFRSLQVGHSGGNQTGEYTFESAFIQGNSVVVGCDVNAEVTQNNAGMITLGRLRVAESAGVVATYTLDEDDAILSCLDETIGEAGTGTFDHKAGTDAVPGRLTLGELGTGKGIYRIAGGSARLEAGTVEVGVQGVGTFEQFGATCVLSGDLVIAYGNNGNSYLLNHGDLTAANEIVSQVGEGTFTHLDGTNTTGTLYVAPGALGNGTYNFRGGELNADYVYVGKQGTGVFTQDGGTATATVAEAVLIGTGTGGDGTVNLADGTLSTAEVAVGGGAGAVGRLNYSGGRLDANTVYVRNGGTLGLAADLTFAGVLHVNGGAVGMDGPESQHDLILNGHEESPAGLIVTSGSVTAHGLVIAPYDEAGGSQTGGAVELTGTLTVGKASNSVGTYTIGDGSLSATSVVVGDGGRGEFIQHNGTVDVTSSLVVGDDPFGNGQVEVYGGELSAGNVYIGKSGWGSFQQEGGNVTAVTVYVGFATGGPFGSSAAIRSGELTADQIFVADNGRGSFTTHGGTTRARVFTIRDGGSLTLLGGMVRVGALIKAPDATFSPGTDNSVLLVNGMSGFGDEFAFGGTFGVGHSDGPGVGSYAVGADQSLTIDKVLIVGHDGRGTLNQSGGIVTNEGLNIGYTIGEGTYELSGEGELFSAAAIVGNAGIGRFVQTGGEHRVGNQDEGGLLVVGSHALGQGMYDLRDGDLVAVLESIGGAGEGVMKQTGGTNTASAGIVIGATGGRGYYQMSGGVATTGAVTVGSNGFGALAYDGGRFDVLGNMTVAGDNGSGIVMLDRATLTVGTGLTLYKPLMGGGASATLAYVIHGTTAGSDYGQVLSAAAQGAGPVPATVVTAAASVAGTLIADFTNYTPVTGDTFDLVTGFAEVTGTFDSVSIVGLTPDFQYSLAYDDGTVRLTADSNGVAAEPGSTSTEIDASGIGGSSGVAGGVAVLFDDTPGGILTSLHRHRDGSTLGDDPFLPPLPDGLRIAGSVEAQYWDVSYDGTSTGFVHVTFCYDEDLLGDDDERTLTLHHHNGSDWDDLEILDRDATANTLSVRVTGFSPFFLSGGEPVGDPTTLTWDGTDPAEWTSAHWNPGPIPPRADKAMVVNSGTVTVTTDLTAPPGPAGSLAIAGGGTVSLSPSGALGVTGGVTVGPGGTLLIDGVLYTPLVTVSGGVLATGSGDVGEAEIEGNAVLTDGATLAVEADDTGIDRLHCTGSLTIDSSASLDITVIGFPAPGLGATMPLIDVDEGLEGIFGHVDGVLHGINQAFAVTYQPNGATVRVVRPGDFEVDGDVDFSDFTYLAANYGQSGKTWVDGDCDGNGSVEFPDFTYLAANYGTSDPDSFAEAPSAGAVELHVDVVTGEMWLVGNAATLSGYSITSASGSLVPDGDGAAAPFQFYLSDLADDISAANLGAGVLIDGESALDAGYDTSGPMDLAFSYGVFGQGGSVSGQVVAVPEPTCLAMLALGALAMFRRRRR